MFCTPIKDIGSSGSQVERRYSTVRVEDKWPMDSDKNEDMGYILRS